MSCEQCAPVLSGKDPAGGYVKLKRAHAIIKTGRCPHCGEVYGKPSPWHFPYEWHVAATLTYSD